MEKTPTAEEIISIVEATVAAYSNSPVWYKTDIKKYMIQFAKLHVEAALKSAYNNIEYTTVDSSVPYVVEESILNSYPLNNIK